jgi:hypothetical protein
MPFFSKMMGSYPFQLIRGLGPSAVVGGALGAAGAGRGRRTRGAIGGAVGGAAAYGGIRAINSMGGLSALGTFGRNMMRPGVAGMYGRSAMNSGRQGLAGMMRRVAGSIR